MTKFSATSRHRSSFSVAQMSLSWMSLQCVCVFGCVQQVRRVSRKTLKCLISPQRPEEHLLSVRLHNKCIHTLPSINKVRFFVFLSEWKLRGRFISVCFAKCFICSANICIQRPRVPGGLHLLLASYFPLQHFECFWASFPNLDVANRAPICMLTPAEWFQQHLKAQMLI